MATDASGVIIYTNETLARWLGFELGTLPSGYVIQDILTKATGMYFDAQIAPMLRMQKFVREISCKLAPLGSDMGLPVLMNAKLRETTDGAIDRIDYIFFDATERRQFEETLQAARSQSEELAAIVKNATIGIVRVDANGRLKRWNATAERLFGGAKAPVVGEKITEILDFGTTNTGWFDLAKTVIEREGEYHFEGENSHGVFVNISVSEIANTHDPFADADYSVILRDVTLRIQNDRRLSIMMQELNHRVKNTFAIVSALVRQSMRAPEFRSERQKLIDRLQSVAASHSTLTAHYWQDVDISELMKPLVAQVSDDTRFAYSGPRVPLATSQYKAISMAFHELMTNALKYGALSGDAGKVSVQWGLTGPDAATLELSWIESGGPAVQPPRARGFGSTMLEDMLAMEFGGSSEMIFPPSGLQFRFRGSLT